MAGFQTYVAWRYLMAKPRRARAIMLVPLVVTYALAFGVQVLLKLAPSVGTHWHGWVGIALNIVVVLLALANEAILIASFLRHVKVALIIHAIGLVTAIGCTIAMTLLIRHYVATSVDPSDVLLLRVLGYVVIGAVVLSGLAAFFGTLRCFFTFFTTVPIGGVFIGTGALVCVLSVMGGFESDLREKILGSNAHIQITRDDGEELTDWRPTKARIDAIPGVVASTPYAMSEVVIASNNNPMNVIIKGIDPKTVGRVTELVKDLKDKDALQALEPLATDAHDLVVPQGPRAPNTIDPPPADMPTGTDPIDFSGSGSAAGSGSSAARGSGAFGGDAPHVLGIDDLPPVPPMPTLLPSDQVVDPPPAGTPTTDDPPVDYSAPGNLDKDLDGAVKVLDLPDDPTISRRTQMLPGILVGSELVKQTHLYAGQEVRVVSPLSDPSNPDATGTPIPFNRDYRVAGVFYTGMYEYDLKYVYVSLESLQDFLDRGDTIDGIEVRIGDPDDTDRYVKTIGDALGPQYRVQDWKELNRSLFSALKLEKIAMFLVLGIVILVASFSIVGNLIMVVVEKAREIALLKTLGASDSSVMQLFAIQGLLIGLVGTGLGVGMGLLACVSGQLFGLPLNPDVYYIDTLPIHIDPASVAASAAAGVVISIAATLYPALLAARVRPAAGMRH